MDDNGNNTSKSDDKDDGDDNNIDRGTITIIILVKSMIMTGTTTKREGR